MDNYNYDSLIPMPPPEEIAIKMRVLIDRSGLTVSEVAERSGISLQTIYRIMSGYTTDPRYATLRAIVIVCRGSFDELIGLKPCDDSPDGEDTAGRDEVLREIRESLRRCEEKLDRLLGQSQ